MNRDHCGIIIAILALRTMLVSLSLSLFLSLSLVRGAQL